MRKKLILLLICLLSMSILTVEAEEQKKCDGYKYKEILKELEEISFEYEYLEEGAVSDLGDDISGMFKVTSPNMPENVVAYFFDSEDIGHGVSSEFYSALRGGVYTVKFTHVECNSQVVKEIEIFVPMYNEYEGKDVWFDGTYENKLVNYEDEGDKISTTLVVILVILLTIIFLGAIYFVIKKRRKVQWTEN